MKPYLKLSALVMMFALMTSTLSGCLSFGDDDDDDDKVVLVDRT